MINCLGCEITVLSIVQLFIGLFISIALIQSGIDKITDRSGNLEWLTGHFSESILKNTVPMMLSIVTVLELAAGGLCLTGGIMVILGKCNQYLLYGLIISGVNFLALFFGQRIAKDYEGAAVLVGYFILVILGLLTFTI